MYAVGGSALSSLFDPGVVNQYWFAEFGRRRWI